MFRVYIHGSLNVPIEHHPTIRYMVYNGYYKVMSNSPKMGHLPIPDIYIYIYTSVVTERIAPSTILVTGEMSAAFDSLRPFRSDSPRDGCEKHGPDNQYSEACPREMFCCWLVYYKIIYIYISDISFSPLEAKGCETTRSFVFPVRIYQNVPTYSPIPKTNQLNQLAGSSACLTLAGHSALQ